jgi:hypothetical protein
MMTKLPTMHQSYRHKEENHHNDHDDMVDAANGKDEPAGDISEMPSLQ